MPPLLFIGLVLGGALLLVLVLTFSPRNNVVLGLLLAIGLALLLVPLGWLVVHQMQVSKQPPAPTLTPARERSSS